MTIKDCPYSSTGYSIHTVPTFREVGKRRGYKNIAFSVAAPLSRGVVSASGGSAFWRKSRSALRGLIQILALLLSGTTGVAAVDATVQEIRTAQEHAVVMENEYVRLSVDLLHGARVTEFQYKPLNRRWLNTGDCLFADHIWQQNWPGELYDAPYECEILERGPAKVAVKVRRSLTDKGPVNYAGIKLERTLILAAAAPALEVEVALTNPSDQVKTMGYWSQHIFRLGGLDGNFYIRPSANGLDVATVESREDGRIATPLGEDFVKLPAASWTATINPYANEAAVFLMDYNELRWIYNCLMFHTTEFYYDLVRMAPGQVWKTRITLLPLQGYRGVSFASREIVADVRLVRCPDGFRLAYTAGCGVAPQAKVVWKVTLVSMDGKKTLGQETIAWDKLDFQPQERLSSLPLPLKGPPVVVKVAVSGSGFAQAFEKSIEDFNRTDRLVAGAFKTEYAAKRPEKLKVLDKPAASAKTAHAGWAVYEAQGQFFDAWKLKEALAAKGKYNLIPGHFSADAYGEQLDRFPASYPEIMALDAVVLNNVSADAISPQDMALLKDYVKNGGGLLVLGGWYAFGGGHYGESGLAELLPVESGSLFDIRRYPQGLPVEVVPGGPLAGVQMTNHPVVKWLQESPRLRPDAKVALKAGGKPLVVLGTFGKGRVACVLASATGKSTPEAPVFCEDGTWPAVLGKIIEWLKTGAQP